MIDYINKFKELSQASVLIALIPGLYYFKQLNASFKVLVGYFMVSSLVELSVFIMYQTMGKVNNMPFLHFLTLVEFWLLLYVFLKYFSLDIKIYCGAVVFFLLVALLDAFYFNSIYVHNTIARPTESILLVLCSFYYYYLNLKSAKQFNLNKEAMYWFSTAVTTYFALDFFGFLLMNKMLTEQQQLVTVIHGLFNIVSYVLYAKAFTCFKWKA